MRLAVLLALAGCGRVFFDPLGDGGAGGGGGDDAPGGGGGDGALTGDGPMPDAAPLAAMCGNTVIIDDKFDTVGMTGWNAVNTGSYMMQESGGLQQIFVVTSIAPNTRAGLQQQAVTDFTNTCAIAELSLAASGANVRSYLRLGTPTKNLEIYVENGQLLGRFTTNGGGTTGTIGPRTYNATQMRFLRMRWFQGNYQFEYGPNLSSWTMFGQQGGGLVDPNPSTLEIGVSVVGAVGASTRAEFERVLFLGP